MAVRQVTVGYSDGTHKTMPVRCDQTVLDAAEEHGVAIVNECQSGICGTCVATCTAGRYQMGRTEGLSDVERAARKILTCQTFVTSDCRIELQYPVDDNAALLVTGDGVVTAVELVSPSTAILRVDTSGMAGALRYRAGQFAQLQVPGTNVWRNYSYAHPADGRGECEFIIRLLPDGVMSNYLRDRAQPGDHIALRCSKGSFYLRPIVRPVILVAGGTGLSAILAMAQSLDADVAHPVYLLYGVERTEDLCKLDELTELRRRVGRLEVHVVVARPDPDWDGRTGLVTDLLDERMLASGDADVYLCGPVAMVDAARTWLDHNGFHRVGLYYEKFVASGAARRRTPARLDYAGVDIAEVCRRGRGTAVVIGGSIAGIAAAKMLSETFDRVIVLEKDGPHRRREGRPGAAQGWHLHHLLTAGQIELERIFPGIVDDMVREGAFKVDMAAQYRIRLGGTWKKPGTSDIEIVCAGRPLLEWCVRRRLDDEPRIDFRYESEVADLAFDRANNAIVGVAGDNGDADGGDGLQVVPAEFVVDASGKNTRVPEFLERLGVGAPEAEQDIIKLITYTSDDIRSISPVAQQHVQTGMTIGQLCDAAIRYSDGTAANLLLADLGGPGGGTAAFTGYLRSLGDTVSRLDAEEPELNRDPPGDERDTTTPHAIALVLQQLVLGNALPPDKRALLTDWMARNTTGAKRIRAGFPADWKVIDKTGTGDYGRANDIAVVWSPTGVPYVVAVMSDRAGGGYDAEPREALLAEAATCVAGVLA